MNGRHTILSQPNGDSLTVRQITNTVQVWQCSAIPILPLELVASRLVVNYFLLKNITSQRHRPPVMVQQPIYLECSHRSSISPHLCSWAMGWSQNTKKKKQLCLSHTHASIGINCTYLLTHTQGSILCSLTLFISSAINACLIYSMCISSTANRNLVTVRSCLIPTTCTLTPIYIFTTASTYSCSEHECNMAGGRAPATQAMAGETISKQYIMILRHKRVENATHV